MTDRTTLQQLADCLSELSRAETATIHKREILEGCERIVDDLAYRLREALVGAGLAPTHARLIVAEVRALRFRIADDLHVPLNPGGQDEVERAEAELIEGVELLRQARKQFFGGRTQEST